MRGHVVLSSYRSLKYNALGDGGVEAIAAAAGTMPCLGMLEYVAYFKNLFLACTAVLLRSLQSCNVSEVGGLAILEMARTHPAMTSILFRYDEGFQDHALVDAVLRDKTPSSRVSSVSFPLLPPPPLLPPLFRYSLSPVV